MPSAQNLPISFLILCPFLLPLETEPLSASLILAPSLPPAYRLLFCSVLQCLCSNYECCLTNYPKTQRLKTTTMLVYELTDSVG